MIRNEAYRWILLTLGLIAILALTALDIFSLFDTRTHMVDTEQTRQIGKLNELTLKVRHELYQPFFALTRLDLNDVALSVTTASSFPEKINRVVQKTSENTLFEGIYFTPEGIDPCDNTAKIFAFDYSENNIIYTSHYPEFLCGSVGLIRTKTHIQLNDFDYRWNSTIEFDTDRSMNIGLINVDDGKVLGYFTYALNKENIINDLISPLLSVYFDTTANKGVTVWLHDWVNDEILATNNPNQPFNIESVADRISFPGFLTNWNFKISFSGNPILIAYNNTLVNSLFVLITAFVLLLTAFLFMFYTAQKDRRLSNQQAEFLANVTHELKTPLAVMQAAGENISDGRVTEKERLKKYGHHIYSESIRLKKMIEKILDVVKADSGLTIINPSPHDLSDIVQKYIDSNRSYIESNGFEILFESNMQDDFINIDHETIQTILNNLTDNAIKYSIDKKVITYSIRSDGDKISLSVKDKGVGISKKDLKNIFKKFYRVEDPLIARTKGHGLGLNIVMQLVELNNGVINVTSELGEGTTFTISFPIFNHSNHA